jgi:ABC-type nitrate/sulfonate/bicarbonate transport system substrate-binding protein
MARRSFLKTSAGALTTGAVAGGLAAPAIGQGLTKVRMTLPWLPQGAQLYPFVARNKGFWRSRGLDVEIARGFGSGAAIQALTQGQFDLGMVAVPTVVLSNARGLETVGMGIAGYDVTMGIMVLEDGPIKTIKDLEGRRIGSVPTSVEVPYVKPFLERSGVDPAKVTTVQLAANVHETSLINKQVDAISAVATSNMPNLVAQGIKFRFFPFSAQGLRIYSNAFMATPQYLAANRQICQAWVEGMCDGIKFAMTNFDEAVETFLREVPEVRMAATGREFTRMGWGLTLATQFAPELTENGVGWFDPKSVANQIDLIMQFVATGADAKRPDVAKTWSTAFVGGVKMTSGEIAAAKNVAKPFAEMLSAII